MVDGTGKRFNEGKLRYDLVPSFAQEQYVKVLTAGSKKYSDNNWRYGMKWSSILASMKRHIAAIEQGEDFDQETGEYHAAHIQCNAAFLTEYYKIYPQGDDRLHYYLYRPKIGLDIDGVLADFIMQYEKYYEPKSYECWNFDKDMMQKMIELSNNKEFWCEMPVLTSPSEIGFEPHCYITSRSLSNKWTEEWIEKNGFPTMAVYSVGYDQSKVEAVKASGIDIFVDDRFENFVEINKAGICCYLFDAPYNRRYNVGHKRIKSLKELI